MSYLLQRMLQYLLVMMVVFIMIVMIHIHNDNYTIYYKTKLKSPIDKREYSNGYPIVKLFTENASFRRSTSPSFRPELGCSPHHHIMFLKTHKTASTTVQNIFLRYGYQHNLTFAFARKDLGPFQWTIYGNVMDIFNYNMLSQPLLPPSGIADIFTLHSRLNISEHTKAVHPDAKWITIIRDPVQQLTSAYNFFHMDKFYKMDLESFLKQPIEVLRGVNFKRHSRRLVRNSVLFDMGYPDIIPLEEVDEVIKTLDNLFHYVMISDRMDESLILLKNLLCWTNSDILVFAKNARKHGNETLNKNIHNKIRQMNVEDSAIYDYFLAKHIQAVEKFGMDKMVKEVNELQKLKNEYYNYCIAKEDLNTKIPTLILSSKSKNNETCILLTMTEPNLVEFLIKHQTELLKKS